MAIPLSEIPFYSVEIATAINRLAMTFYFIIYIINYVSSRVNSIFLNIVALNESRYCWGTLRYALSPVAAAISFALGASMTPLPRRLSSMTSAVALSSDLPTELTMCMIVPDRVSLIRVMRIYPPPPRLDSTMYPCSGVKREVMT